MREIVTCGGDSHVYVWAAMPSGQPCSHVRKTLKRSVSDPSLYVMCYFKIKLNPLK